MTRRYTVVAGMLTVATLACGGQGAGTMETLADSASYAIGMNMGSQLGPARGEVNPEQLMAGMRDALEGADARLNEQDAMRVLQTFAHQVREAEMASRAGDGERNRTEGDAYRAQNGAKDGVMTTASGLQYEVLSAGSGAQPGASDRVTVHYHGTLIDGTVFDSSVERGEPVTFSLAGVIPGWTEGVQLMQVGSRYRFVIPPDLAYGENGAGQDIGPGATLIFEVELLEIAE